MCAYVRVWVRKPTCMFSKKYVSPMGAIKILHSSMLTSMCAVDACQHTSQDLETTTTTTPRRCMSAYFIRSGTHMGDASQHTS